MKCVRLKETFAKWKKCNNWKTKIGCECWMSDKQCLRRSTDHASIIIGKFLVPLECYRIFCWKLFYVSYSETQKVKDLWYPLGFHYWDARNEMIRLEGPFRTLLDHWWTNRISYCKGLSYFIHITDRRFIISPVYTPREDYLKERQEAYLFCVFVQTRKK